MKRCLIFVCVLIAVSCIYGCTGPDNQKDTLPSGKYVAVLEDYTNHSTLVGTPPYPTVEPMAIPTPVPVFNYDNPQWLQGQLGQYGVVVNDSLKAIVCKITYIDTPTMMGYWGYKLEGVYALPYTIDDGITIVDISKNGTLTITYDNQSSLLKPGKSWTTIEYSDNITGAYIANTQNISMNDYYNLSRNATVLPWPVNNERTYKITNEGVYNRSVLNKTYGY